MKYVLKSLTFLVFLSWPGQCQVDDHVKRIVMILEDLKGKSKADLDQQEESYNKFACWCEDTLSAKTSAIRDGNTRIEVLEPLIVRLKSDVAVQQSQIQQYGKDIEDNKKSQKDATDQRENELSEYETNVEESNQCIGALQAAIAALTDAGTGKSKGFLETKQAKLLTVAAGVRKVLAHPTLKVASMKDLELVKAFIDRPSDFFGKHPESVSATQVGNNPFGDYAPQSTQIMGILKQMEETFVKDLATAHEEEASAKKAFGELIATKQMELDMLEHTLGNRKVQMAETSQKETEKRTELADTQENVAAAEEVFGDTKAGCQEKATFWSSDKKLRLEEFNAMCKAIEILKDGEAKFERSAESFVQVRSVQMSRAAQASEAYSSLVRIASRGRSYRIARIAADIKLGGHFDKLIDSIDSMMAQLRKEELDDVNKKDECEKKLGSQNAEQDDVRTHLEKAQGALNTLEAEKVELDNDMKKTRSDIEGQKTLMNSLKAMRLDAEQEHKKAMRADDEAHQVIGKAIQTLRAFYKNKLSMVAVSSHDEPPPKFGGESYKGRKESGDVIGILEMIQTDLELDMQESAKQDAEAQKTYVKQRTAMEKSLAALEALLLSQEKEMSENSNQQNDMNDVINTKTEASQNLEELLVTSNNDCAWVKSHFESRRTKRQQELKGLQDAKSYLHGSVDL